MQILYEFYDEEELDYDEDEDMEYSDYSYDLDQSSKDLNTSKFSTG